MTAKQPSNTKLTWDAVRAIRQQYTADNTLIPQLAAAHGVTQGTICFVIDNITWHDPEYSPPPRTRRGARGENHSSARLTGYQVRAIRHRYATERWLTHSRLAEEYGVSRMAICHIINNQTWHDPDYSPPRAIGGAMAAPHGPRNGRSKLTWAHVREIRRLYATGKYTHRQLAPMFNVSRTTIHFIINGTTWPDPQYTPPQR